VLGVSTNVDERLLCRWEESQHRQQMVRTVLARSSLSVDRFEGWALELIADALSARHPEGEGMLPTPRTTIGVHLDDR
jgi:hypothetical protein